MFIQRVPKGSFVRDGALRILSLELADDTMI
jgi:hypothetical protein